MRSLSRNQHNDDYYNDCNDVYILKEQIQIKSESLLLLSQQLENSIKEKDEFKRLIDTLYDKNLILKKKLYNQQHQDSTSPSSFTDAAKVFIIFETFNFKFTLFLLCIETRKSF